MSSPLIDVAPAFVRMAHEIVWCSAATVDRSGRPRSRVLPDLGVGRYKPDRLDRHVAALAQGGRPRFDGGGGAQARDRLPPRAFEGARLPRPPIEPERCRSTVMLLARRGPTHRR